MPEKLSAQKLAQIRLSKMGHFIFNKELFI